MKLSDYKKQLLSAAKILLIGLLQTGVYAKPTNYESQSSVHSSADILSMDYHHVSTTPKIIKLHSRDIALGELLSKSVAEDSSIPETQKRYRRLCKYYYHRHSNNVM